MTLYARPLASGHTIPGATLRAVLGAAAGTAFILAHSVPGFATVLLLVVAVPVILVGTVRTDLLMTFLFAMSGTALAGTVLGRESVLSGAGGLNPSSLTLLVVLGALLGSLILRPGWISPGLRPAVVHAVFVGFAAASIAWAPSTLVALREWAKLLFPLVVVAAAYAVWRRRPRPRMLRIMYWVGVAIVVTGPFVFLAGNPGTVVWAGDRALYSGSWGVATYTFGAYTGLLAIYALVRYHTERRMWLLAVALIFALSTLATGVRSAIFPLFIVGGTYLYLRSRSRWRFWYPFAGIAALVVAVTTIPSLRDRTFGTRAGEWATLTKLVTQPSDLLRLDAIRWTRIGAWGVATGVYLANPVGGGGVGAVRAQIIGPQALDSGAIRGGYGAGEYMSVLGDLGTVGLGLLVLTYVSYGLRLKRDFEARRDQPHSAYSLLALLWLLFFGAFCFAYNGFANWTISFMVFAATGIALAEAHRFGSFEASRALGVARLQRRLVSGHGDDRRPHGHHSRR